MSFDTIVKFADLGDPITRTCRPAWDGKPLREVETRWALTSEADGVERFLELTTSHRRESKAYSVTLTWVAVRDEGGYSVVTWASDYRRHRLFTKWVDRYSKRDMVDLHATILARLDSEYGDQVTDTIAQALTYDLGR